MNRISKFCRDVLRSVVNFSHTNIDALSSFHSFFLFFLFSMARSTNPDVYKGFLSVPFKTDCLLSELKEKKKMSIGVKAGQE